MGMLPRLQVFESGGGKVSQLESGSWRLSLPADGGDRYRLGQLDDYHRQPRSRLPWQAPVCLEVAARLSSTDAPGTWGFGFWNDPFSVSLGLGGMGRRLPALPNCAWFFYASPSNYLALRDDHPACGFLAATFSSPLLPALLLALGLPFAPALLWPPAAVRLRRAARRWIHESAAEINVAVTEWHRYRIELEPRSARFSVDSRLCFETNCAPQGSLGLVIWIDNQFAAFPPDGKLRLGTLPSTQPVWMEVTNLKVAQAPC